ncbi:hypothetical protein N7528_009217 [Penicillium herquei]|nr:hypothetical protein N7528_009217 [Penicillium herquei]
MACQLKYGYTPEMLSIPTEEAYIVMMEICPLWVHGRPFGKAMYHNLWKMVSDASFAQTERGHLVWLALAMEQEVYVNFHDGEFHIMAFQSARKSAVLKKLTLVNVGIENTCWQATFCFEDLEVHSVVGYPSQITQFFLNPRLSPATSNDSLER